MQKKTTAARELNIFSYDFYWLKNAKTAGQPHIFSPRTRETRKTWKNSRSIFRPNLSKNQDICLIFVGNSLFSPNLQGKISGMSFSRLVQTLGDIEENGQNREIIYRPFFELFRTRLTVAFELIVRKTFQRYQFEGLFKRKSLRVKSKQYLHFLTS